MIYPDQKDHEYDHNQDKLSQARALFAEIISLRSHIQAVVNNDAKKSQKYKLRNRLYSYSFAFVGEPCFMCIVEARAEGFIDPFVVFVEPLDFIVCHESFINQSGIDGE